MSTTRSTTAAPSTAGTVWLVAEREITARLRSKSFLISTGILLLAVLVSIVLGSILSANASSQKTKVAAVASVSASIDGVEGLTVTTVDSADAAKRLVQKGTVDAAVVPSDSRLGFAVIALSSTPESLVSQLSDTPKVTLLDPPKQNGFLLYFVSLGFGIVFFISATTFGSTIAQSVVEEKQTRVVEILMATIPVRLLLAGKVVGNSLLAFGQVAVIAIIVGVGLAVSGQGAILSLIGPALIWFVVFFVFGFVLLASLFAAAASLVSRQEDMAAVTTPVTMLAVIPYILVIAFNSNPLVVGIMSYVPFSAAVGMPVRIFLGSAAWWEPVLSLIILILSTVGVILIGSRIYGNSLLHMGGRVKLKDALAR